MASTNPKGVAVPNTDTVIFSLPGDTKVGANHETSRLEVSVVKTDIGIESLVVRYQSTTEGFEFVYQSHELLRDLGELCLLGKFAEFARAHPLNEKGEVTVRLSFGLITASFAWSKRRLNDVSFDCFFCTPETLYGAAESYRRFAFLTPRSSVAQSYSAESFEGLTRYCSGN